MEEVNSNNGLDKIQFENRLDLTALKKVFLK